MKKHYLKKIKNEETVIELLSVLKKDADEYEKSIEEKFGDNYQNIKKKYGIKSYRKINNSIRLGKNIIYYEYQYPDKDPNNSDRNLSNEWGYYMVFKNIGSRLQEKLITLLSKRQYKENEQFRVKINGYLVKINITKIKKN